MQTSVGITNERVLRGSQYFWFAVLTVLLLVSTGLFLANVLSGPWWQEDGYLSALYFLLVLLFVFNPIVRWGLLTNMMRPVSRPASVKRRVAVVTTYVPGAEPIDMLERTLRAMVDIEYPHDTWVLDEGNSPKVKHLCVALGARHFSRKSLPQYQTESGVFQIHSKYGNYNAWLQEIGFAGYDIVTAFDPDHVPSPVFLDEVIGFFDDPQIGYVQAAQAYYNQEASFIAAGAAQETYDYYSTLQMASYGFGYPIVTGCHNSHRCSALRDVGGFAAHDADDLLITIAYRSKGWQGVYVPKVLARGLTPVDWAGYLRQQRRWARSVLDLKLRVHGLFTSQLPLRTRVMSNLHGLNYLQPTVMFLGGLAITLVSILRGRLPAALTGANPIYFALLAAALVACYFFRQQFYLDPSREWGFNLQARLMRFVKAPFLLLALWDVVVGHRRGYELTAKVRSSSRRPVLPPVFGTLAVLVLLAWAQGASSVAQYPLILHVLAGAAVVFLMALVASEYREFPAPYDEIQFPWARFLEAEQTRKLP